jgi:DnaJ-domain-containing protein 1
MPGKLSQAQTSTTGHSYEDSQSANRQKQQHTASSRETTHDKAYYQALEVAPGASFDEIKASYKKLVKKYHPDLFHNNPEKRRYAEIVTQKINEAYTYFEQKSGVK